MKLPHQYTFQKPLNVRRITRVLLVFINFDMTKRSRYNIRILQKLTKQPSFILINEENTRESTLEVLKLDKH